MECGYILKRRNGFEKGFTSGKYCGIVMVVEKQRGDSDEGDNKVCKGITDSRF
jgi:hypothetical protein